MAKQEKFLMVYCVVTHYDFGIFGELGYLLYV